MELWKPKIKNYPHFDAPIPRSKIVELVSDASKVASNKFYPFLFYDKIVPKFGKKLSEIKPRRIRYAARRDAYIFSYYRHVLSKKYEERLANESLGDNIIAYRKIPVEAGGESGKCNIHFAQECFEEIAERAECYAIALDISSYFECLEHEHLKNVWIDLMDFEEMPADHMCVFKNITTYAEVDFDKVCEALGFKGKVQIKGKEKFGFKRELPRKTFFKEDCYKQLCSPEEFRSKIVGLVRKNDKGYGIPQGSPISDILANIYLLDFDKNIKSFLDECGGYYRRYSDDILIILPSDKKLLHETLNLVRQEIKKAGDKLEIKDSKTIVKEFYIDDDKISCSPINAEGIENVHEGCFFEYLGFAFDGTKVRLKDATMHRFNRKMIYAGRHEAATLVKRYRGKSKKSIMEKLNFSLIYQRFGRVKDIGNHDFYKNNGFKKLTFYAYAKKAHKIMTKKGLNSQISFQLKKHKKNLKSVCLNEIDAQFKKNI